MKKILNTLTFICYFICFISIASSITSLYTKEVLGEEKIIPIYRVKTDEKKVAITFDLAWESFDMFDILNILKENNIKSTFFICGYWIDDNPEIVKAIYNEGHEIASHGDRHKHANELNYEENKKEITEVKRKAKDLLGIDINLFRAPYGEYNNILMTAAKDTDTYVIQWDVDSHDWLNKGVDYEVNQVINNKNLNNGSIILFHSGTKTTPKSLEIIIDELKNKGYSFDTIGNMIYKDNYEISYSGEQIQKK